MSLSDPITLHRLRAVATGLTGAAKRRLRFEAGSNVTMDVTELESELRVTINASGQGGGGGAPTDAQYVTLSTDATLTAERVLTAGTGISITDGGAGGNLTVASTITQGAPTDSQYVTLATDGDLSNERVLTAGTGISITDGGAGGNVTIASTVTSGAPTDSQYVTLATYGDLSNERVLTAGTGISITDGGAGGNVTIASTVTAGAPTDAQYVTLATNGSLSGERVLTAGDGITITDGGANGNVTVANDNPIVLTALKPSDQAISSQTTFQNATGLSFSVQEAGTYAFDGWILHQSSTTADIRWRFTNSDGGGSMRWNGDWSRDVTVVTNTGTLTGQGRNSNRVFMVRGYFVVATAPATIQLQFRQNTSQTSATTVRANSWMTATKVS